jgi:ABC-type phosphate transport system substrate-binding protein
MSTLPQRFAATLLLALGSVTAAADVVVVVSPRNPLSSMTRRQVADIFLGKSQRFPDGRLAVPFDQAAGSAVQTQFYLLVDDKRAAEIKAYWAKMIFTGRGQPPATVGDDKQMKQALAAQPNAIGYLDRQAVDDSVKMLSLGE